MLGLESFLKIFEDILLSINPLLSNVAHYFALILFILLFAIDP